MVVLGLARGGIPVAYEVATALAAPLDVLVVRKLGAPYNPELAIGSIAMGGVTVYNRWIMEQLCLEPDQLAGIVEREQRELARRERAYRGDRPFPKLTGKTVILVDDGAATGATMQAGVESVRALAPRRIVVALPTSSHEAADRLADVADETIVLAMPEPYWSVGGSYDRFDQLSDAEVAEFLARARAAPPREPGSDLKRR